jgi:hypothetical protein
MSNVTGREREANEDHCAQLAQGAFQRAGMPLRVLTECCGGFPAIAQSLRDDLDS